MTRNDKLLARFARECTEKGLLIEAGWAALQLAAIPPNASPDQLKAMRMAFFAGAQHLFGSIMNILDPGDEPTPADLRTMDSIDKELRIFIAEFERDHNPPKKAN